MDAAKSQGADVSPQDALDFIVPILEGMDQKQAEGRLIKTDKNAKEASRRSDAEAAAAEFQKRARDKGGEWTVTKRGADLAQRLEKPALSPMEQRMVQRLRLLRSKPELRKQMEALVPALNHPNKDIAAKAHGKLDQLLERSNALFGDWRKEPVRKMYF